MFVCVRANSVDLWVNLDACLTITMVDTAPVISGMKSTWDFVELSGHKFLRAVDHLGHVEKHMAERTRSYTAMP